MSTCALTKEHVWLGETDEICLGYRYAVVLNSPKVPTIRRSLQKIGHEALFHDPSSMGLSILVASVGVTGGPHSTFICPGRQHDAYSRWLARVWTASRKRTQCRSRTTGGPDEASCTGAVGTESSRCRGNVHLKYPYQQPW